MITVGEPLPIDGKNERLYRTGILSQLMADEGHEVTWWTSSFNHTKRAQRTTEQMAVRVSPNLTIRIVPEPGYSKSVSVRRILSHATCARRFRKMAMADPRPDVILVSYPTIELSRAAIRLGKKMDVPVVVDIRDLWPDIFLQIFPRGLRGLGKLCLWPYDYFARQVFRNADAIVAITAGIRDWGLTKAGREPGPLDRDFPFGYAAQEAPDPEATDARAFWASRGVTDDNWNICFFGAIGKQTRFEPVIQAARLLQEELPQVRFIICGTGEMLPEYEQMAKGLSNVLFPGWVDKNQINTLMALSQMGLTAYPSSEDFLLSIPNKPIEYLSAGLPILSNIDGVLGALIRENRVGATYRSSDPSSLIDALGGLIDDPAAVDAMRAASHALFEREFDAQKVYSNYSEYLQSVARVM
jgi:glycosyltransferase involved in cell wall biosynthesis